MDITQEIQKKEIKTNYRFNVEKLDGGFISDVTGKRKIYRDEHDIADEINIDNILNQSEDGEYLLKIDILTKAQVEDLIDLEAQLASNTSTEPIMMSYEEAKAQGVIQGVDKFDPNPNKNEPVIEKEIAVTEENAYRSGRLKAIDWKYFDEAIQMTNVERSAIAGCSQNTLYNQWKKAVSGKASFHLTKTRIIFTVLAKYYEANLDIRTSTKDQLVQTKATILDILKEMELMANFNKFTKSSEIKKKIEEVRKALV